MPEFKLSTRSNPREQELERQLRVNHVKKWKPTVPWGKPGNGRDLNGTGGGLPAAQGEDSCPWQRNVPASQAPGWKKRQPGQHHK